MPDSRFKKILIIDPDCPTAYHEKSLLEKPMGGTEATIIRVGRGLSERGHKVVVAQGARSEEEMSKSGLEYHPFSLKGLGKLLPDAEVVIVINSPKLLRKTRRAYPAARLFLWMHCFPGKRRKKIINKYAAESWTSIIAVSDTLRSHVEDCLSTYPEYGRNSKTGGRLANVLTVFNPVDDELLPDHCQVDPSKLVFFSSPHKGLEQVLEAFSAVKKEFPSMRLCLANPGYWPMPENIEEEAVEILGALKHEEVMEHVREAFCVFYPQSRFKETFGLVFAEANAVGTPVITHSIGAAGEVLKNKEQLVDVTDTENVVKKLKKWIQNGRPQVDLDEKFRLRKVLDSWENLFRIKDSVVQPLKQQ